MNPTERSSCNIAQLGPPSKVLEVLHYDQQHTSVPRQSFSIDTIFPWLHQHTLRMSSFLHNILWTYDYINALRMSSFLHNILWTYDYINTLLMSSFYMTFCQQMATTSTDTVNELFFLHTIL
jgi:hypothetical protein